MHLRVYLETNGRGTAGRIAREAGVNTSTIARLAADKVWPGRRLWQQIVAATGGQVTPNDHINAVRDEEAHAEEPSPAHAGA